MTFMWDGRRDTANDKRRMAARPRRLDILFLLNWYGPGKEVGKLYGISAPRVYQIAWRAKRDLKRGTYA